MAGRVFSYPVNFDNQEFTESFLWRNGFIKRMVFLSVSTWGVLTQKKILSSLGLKTASKSIISSISSNLEAGRKNNIYHKIGIRKGSRFSMHPDYLSSKQLRAIRFVPSERAIAIAKQRARAYQIRLQAE